MAEQTDNSLLENTGETPSEESPMEIIRPDKVIKEKRNIIKPDKVTKEKRNIIKPPGETHPYSVWFEYEEDKFDDALDYVVYFQPGPNDKAKVPVEVDGIVVEAIYNKVKGDMAKIYFRQWKHNVDKKHPILKIEKVAQKEVREAIR